jgi:hypothetical protein
MTAIFSRKRERRSDALEVLKVLTKLSQESEAKNGSASSDAKPASEIEK